MPKIIAIGTYPKPHFEALQEMGATVFRTLSEARKMDDRDTVRAMAYMGKDSVDGAVMDDFPNLGIVANYAVGYDNIDTQAASDRDIAVTNTPTRPRNQGALTSWELGSHGIPHTYVTDNAGGHLMQKGKVDLVIVGTDRTTRRGDVCNKIGTYLKALAARDNGVPFYVALPSPTIDWTVDDGVAEIPIEERRADEVSHIQGVLPDGGIGQVRVTPEGTPAGNPAFDVTPNRLVTGLITERGICDATPEGLAGLFPDMA